MNATAEEWRPIPGHEGRYDVSDLGRVRSWVAYRYSGPLPRVLAQNLISSGYLITALSKDRRSVKHLVHRLVLAAFAGPCPPGQEARHLDGGKANNRLTNLAYGTPRQNGQDRVRHGTGYNHHRLKTACKQGHKFTPENTYRWRNERRCRECGRRRSRAHATLNSAAVAA